jgi:hypothetical protein
VKSFHRLLSTGLWAENWAEISPKNSAHPGTCQSPDVPCKMRGQEADFLPAVTGLFLACSLVSCWALACPVKVSA